MILRNSITFVFIELLNKFIPFILLLILTRFLTPTDYGVIASFGALVTFLGIFIGLSGHGAIDVHFFRLEKNELGIYIANVLFILILTTFLCLSLIYLFSSSIENNLALSLKWQLFALVVVFGQFITLINLSLWIVEQKPFLFGIYQLSQTSLMAIIAIYFIIGLSYDCHGQLIATVISSIIFSFISYVILYKRGYLHLQLNRLYMYDFLRFGIPLIPHQLGGWLRTQGDKIIIVFLIGTLDTGLFTVGYQIGIIMSIFISSLTKSLYPILFKLLNEKILLFYEKRKIVLYTYGLFTIIVILAAVLIFIMDYLYLFLVGDKFYESIYLSKLIIMSSIFEGFYYCVVGYLFYFKKTARLAKTTFFVSILHICISFILVYSFGIVGAGYSLVISSLIQFLLIWRLSNKVYPMPWFSFWRKNEV